MTPQVIRRIHRIHQLRKQISSSRNLHRPSSVKQHELVLLVAKQLRYETRLKA